VLLYALIDLPKLPGAGENEAYVRPAGSMDMKYSEWFEAHTSTLYPLIAIVVVALVAWGIISAWRGDDMDGLAKAELKREIIRLLRRDVYGLSADKLAAQLEIPGGKLLKLLDEMAEENIVESRTSTSRVTTWRMKGLTD
jgi:hypothetical protein